ncbi:MAG TPA: hypothetical protein VNB23_04325 [Ramlibacter sp.]|nr:hypothetical protein [Ramlibacter sp.]
MNKKSLSLIVAGVFAVAGAAQAQATFDTPTRAGEASTMSMGAPNLETSVDTRVMGAAPSGIYAPDTVVTVPPNPMVVDRDAAAATFNVPSRAGEASTMTGGAPNVATDNDRVVVQQHHLYSAPGYIRY